MNEENVEKIKRGYLKKDFEFFHLKDQKNLKFEFHYHDFNKIIIFISGNVTYLIEGKAYKLKPWDILLVNSSEIHKPLIDASGIYERIIIWVNPAFIMKHSGLECDLLTCFGLASKEKLNLLRLSPSVLASVKHTLYQLKEACSNIEFGSHILKNSLFLQFIVHLNRLFLSRKDNNEIGDIEYDEHIEDILSYINAHLQEDLSIDRLSSNFYMSKYYLMHKFKAQTGYTIHNYIQKKRLILSSDLIKKGRTITEVFSECGFGDYSNFFRAFKKMFGVSPKAYYKTVKEIEKAYNENNHV